MKLSLPTFISILVSVVLFSSLLGDAGELMEPRAPGARYDAEFFLFAAVVLILLPLCAYIGGREDSE